MQPAAAPSFLDDWLKKRNTPQTTQGPATQPLPQNMQTITAQPAMPATQPLNVPQPQSMPVVSPAPAPQPIPQEPQPQPYQPQPSEDPGHIKIQNTQHSNQAEDMIVIDR